MSIGPRERIEFPSVNVNERGGCRMIDTMLRYSFVIVAGFWMAGAAHAGTWGDSLFDELSKDFGSVPRGPTLTHEFHVTNNTKNVVRISSVRVSCGCVSATALKGTLNPKEETSIVAKMDTTRFTGSKTVTIYVQFDQPNFDEVRLWVQANGRNDFTLTPDTLAFGQVKRGVASTSSVKIKFYGNIDAKILSVKSESNYVQPTITEIKRADSEVEYELKTKLRADTPVGKWYTDVWIKTNIATMEQVRIPLTVEVESPLTVTPSIITLGVIKANEETMRKIIVRGAAPFRITQIKGIDASTLVAFDSKLAREVHVLTIKVKPGMSGKIDKVLRVITDMKTDNEIDVRVQGTVSQ